MWGIELANPRYGQGATTLATAVQATALRHGLIIELGGRDDSVIRLMPPLNITEDLVDTACTILVNAIEECCPSSRA
jgi:diaminobutyrate-2-oxoglutarate transaminase